MKKMLMIAVAAVLASCGQQVAPSKTAQVSDWETVKVAQTSQSCPSRIDKSIVDLWNGHNFSSLLEVGEVVDALKNHATLNTITPHKVTRCIDLLFTVDTFKVDGIYYEVRQGSDLGSPNTMVQQNSKLSPQGAAPQTYVIVQQESISPNQQ